MNAGYFSRTNWIFMNKSWCTNKLAHTQFDKQGPIIPIGPIVSTSPASFEVQSSAICFVLSNLAFGIMLVFWLFYLILFHWSSQFTMVSPISTFWPFTLSTLMVNSAFWSPRSCIYSCNASRNISHFTSTINNKLQGIYSATLLKVSYRDRNDWFCLFFPGKMRVRPTFDGHNIQWI